MRTVSIPLRGVAVAAFLAGACALPERTSPHDPQNAPVAVLSVSPSQGTRATLFQLDATGSSDPKGRGALRFEWELDDPTYDPGDAASFEDFDVSTGEVGTLEHAFDIPAAFVDSNGEGIIARRVRVRAVAPDGATATDEFTIIVQNRRPVIDPGEDVFVSASRTEPVILDALGGGRDPTSVDPDGDLLDFEWQQLGGEPVTLTPLDERARRVQFAPPADSARSLVFRVAGTDGLAGDVDVIRVHFGPLLWGTTRAPSRVYRHHPGYRDLTGFRDVNGPTFPFEGTVRAIAASADRIWTAEMDGSSQLHVRIAGRNFVGVADATIAGAGVPRWIEAVGTEACLASFNRVYRLDAAAGVIASASLPGATRVHARPDGDCWAVNSTTVHRFGADGTLEQVLAAGSGRLFGPSTTTPDGALWVTTRNDTGTIEPESFAEVFRIPVGGAAVEITEIQGALAIDLAGRVDGGIWMFDLLTRALLVIDGQGGIRVTDAPLVRVGRMIADTADEALWVVDTLTADLVLLFDDGSSVHELGRLSTQKAVPGAPLWAAPAADPVTGGVLVAASATEHHVVQVPSHMRGFERVEFPVDASFPTGISGDPSRGALWLPDYSPALPEIVRISDRGRVLATATGDSSNSASLRDGGAWMAIRNYPANGALLEVGPDGEIRTNLDLGVRFPISLHLDEDAGFFCSSAVDLQSQSFLHRGALDGSAPVDLVSNIPGYAMRDCAVSPDGSTWFGFQADPCTDPPTLVRYAPGALVPSVTVTSAFGMAFNGCGEPDMAIDPRDGGLWFSDTNRIVRFDPAGQPIAEIPVAATSLDVVSCENDPGCVEIWYAEFTGFVPPASMVRLDEGGTVIEVLTPPVGEFVDLDYLP